MWSVPRCYKQGTKSVERQRGLSGHPCGGGSNTSTVILRVVGGDEKGSLKSETVKYGRERKTALARTSSIYKRQTRHLVIEGAPQKQGRNCQTVINI
jgi:hypothetical protein